MKRIGKKVIAAGLALGMVLLAQGVKVEAGEHFDGCQTSMKRVECILPLTGTTGTTHTYYNAEFGMAYCTILIYYGQHKIYCANNFCNAFLGSENRTCIKAHQDCNPLLIETGFCQY